MSNLKNKLKEEGILKEQVPKKSNSVNILIATPAYGGWVHIDHEQSMMEYKDANVPFSLMTMGNESLIPRGRNTCLSYFYQLKDFTHLFFLDADMGLKVEGFARLITHAADIIGAPVRLKGADKWGNPVYNYGEILNKPAIDLWEVTKVGTAILLLSRLAVDKAVENAIKNGDVYGGNPHTRGENKDIDHYDTFKVGVVNGAYESEDFWFCLMMRNLGFKVFIDPTIKNRHNGMYVFGEGE